MCCCVVFLQEAWVHGGNSCVEGDGTHHGVDSAGDALVAKSCEFLAPVRALESA